MLTVRYPRPMIGGMVSSTLLTLVVIPAIHAVVKGISIRSLPAADMVEGQTGEARRSGLPNLWASILVTGRPGPANWK